MGNKDSRDLDWENRILCSDESCIGVIGSDGRCKECGKPYEGELPEKFSESAATQEKADPQDPSEDSPSASLDSDGDTQAADTADEPSADEDQEWEQRILCRDEACIGVIGKDGRCKECGLPLKED